MNILQVLWTWQVFITTVFRTNFHIDVFSKTALLGGKKNVRVMRSRLNLIQMKLHAKP